MSLYLDTSVLVAAITHEPSTARIQAWLAARASDELTISDWVTTEVSSALSIKLRRGDLDLAQRAAALAAFHRISADSLSAVAVLPSHFQVAAHYADRHDLTLRAADALHLAVCAAHGATLVTLDRRFAEAALQLGVAVEAV
ncbi:MAG TPA: type II toxin-antitoxin system VapC family toxin [Phenylobacterium sp.]|nr:type II toxin-antitoxin system VapC family toxin [Phenylobacterium sp.]